MRGQQINRVSTIGLIVLSLTALLTVLLGLALPAVLGGHIPPPEPDEGTGAHIFQLSIAALVPVGFLSLATADWTQPLRSVRRLAFPAAAVVLAFSILFYFEHYYFPAHGSPLPRPGLPLRLLRQVLGAVGYVMPSWCSQMRRFWPTTTSVLQAFRKSTWRSHRAGQNSWTTVSLSRIFQVRTISLPQ